MKVLIYVSLLLGCGFCPLDIIAILYPRVNTLLGTIEGSYDTSNDGRQFEAYKGIPYAHPPIRESRFEVARSISPWTGVLKANEFRSSCMQYNFLMRNPDDKVSGSEDCLYLNIYTPVMDDSYREVNGTLANLLPVIFYIPGGAFIEGNGNNYGPKYLLDRNVTLVTVNYRVGPLGFLSTEDDIVPGNMGLKDQVIALRWVKDNIRYFGGDPSKITIIGHSAGGASVHYLYLTNLTTGLFQRGMSMSGTALNPWSLIKNPLQKAKKLATVVGCSTDSIQSMVDCLKDKPAHQIIQALSNFTELVNNPAKGWGPTVEKQAGEFTFIDRLPIDIIASGDAQDVPWITGVVNAEGVFAVSDYIGDEETLQPLNNEWDTIAPFLLYLRDTIPKKHQPGVARLIKEHYIENKPINGTTINQIVRMIGTRVFVSPAENSAKSQARANRSPVYVYYFSYRGAHSFTEMLTGSSENFGVCHGDDLRYVLHSVFDTSTTVQDREMQQVIINLWMSFVTDGTPDVGLEWPSLSRSGADEFRYLHIAGPKEIRVESTANFGDENFWRTISFRENEYATGKRV